MAMVLAMDMLVGTMARERLSHTPLDRLPMDCLYTMLLLLDMLIMLVWLLAMDMAWAMAMLGTSMDK